MRAGSIISVILIGLLSSACVTRDIDTRRETLDNTTLLIARPSSRLVSVRPRVLGTQTTQVLCTEPSPDVALALARSANFAGSGSAPSSPSASLSGGFTSSETASLLAGRTAGVVALRDGLYVACQAYVNGVIGHDSYAIILSQYGKLLNELVGGGSAGNGNNASSSDKGGGTTATTVPGALVLTIAGGSITSPITDSGRSSTPAASNKTTTQSSTTDAARDDLLLVACIAEFDPTRIAPLDPRTGSPLRNQLLDGNCKTFVKRISSAPSQAPAAVAKAVHSAPGARSARVVAVNPVAKLTTWR